jgi:hypothetical protein
MHQKDFFSELAVECDQVGIVGMFMRMPQMQEYKGGGPQRYNRLGLKLGLSGACADKLHNLGHVGGLSGGQRGSMKAL